MKKYLDKTVSVRQLLFTTTALALLLAIGWFCALTALKWGEKMGGTVAQRSPYYSAIPEDCKPYAGRSNGSAFSSTFVDDIFLRSRVSRGLIIQQGDPFGLQTKCLGYAVLLGASAQQPDTANFTDIFTDQDGKDVVEVRVRYFNNLSNALQKKASSR